MFGIALIILCISYAVFFVGILGLLNTGIASVMALVLISGVVIWQRNQLVIFADSVIRNRSIFSHFQKALILLLLLQFLVNLVGALAPELGFDALWYHLTLPKLYLVWGSIQHIPGGLLYYSDMPKLGEMLYTLLIPWAGSLLPKLVQLLFGAGITLSVYRVSRRYFSKTVSLLVTVIFYANLVVAWESTTAYIDLIRAFYEFLALWAFLLWEETDRKKWFFLAAVLVGGAITTKVLALSSVLIFLLLIIFLGWKKHTPFHVIFRQTLSFFVVAILIPLPWFIFAFLNTGNPLYPIFSSFYHTSYSLTIFNPLHFLVDSWHILTHADDPLNPVYLVFLPLIIFYYQKLNFQMKLITLYSLLGFLSWYFLPQTGGGRFLLAYLPAFSLLAGGVLHAVENQKLFTMALTVLIIIIALITLGYRGFANARYLPVVLGQETKSHFLKTHLNFSFGDFYDTDMYFKTHMHTSDRVLLFGFHNLYYVDFPFIDSSWAKKGDSFDYIATQHTALPARFAYWKPIYTNPLTGVTLYTDKHRFSKY